MTRAALLVALAAAACGSSGAAAVDAAPAPADADKSAACATTFGTNLTDGFSRFDGTVLAVVPPNDPACAKPNMTHLVVEVVIGGKAYRMVVDVISSDGTPDLLDEVDAPLPSPPWLEGVHTAQLFDYAQTLGVHSTAFVSTPEPDLVARITAQLQLGAHISIYATVAGEPDSAHLVHRHGHRDDGAIVIDADTAPHWLLIRFAIDTF